MSSFVPLSHIRTTLGDARLQEAIYGSTARLQAKRRAALEPLPEFEDLREQARQVKAHTIGNLAHYLQQLEANVQAQGGEVIWAETGEQAVAAVLDIARRESVRLAVKSKSMTTEELHLNDHFEAAGIEVVETDLGEYILQLAKEKPYHIVAPALHKTRYDVADLFTQRLGVEREEVIEKQTLIARRVLREKFLAADLGITGANFLVADSGAAVVVENEGNARLSSTVPRVQIVVAGIEKLIPRAQDLATFLKILARSATGQPLSVYTSFLSGPRRANEIDGPERFYLVLVDGGRTQVLADEHKRESLQCIRCGACLNHCPVYRKIGGHSYPWVYSGPIGAILSPQFHGLHKEGWMASASSLCGACGQVCPVKIDIPRILLELRAQSVKQAPQWAERLAFRLWAWVIARPKLYAALAPAGVKMAGRLRFLPPIKAWLSERELPAPPVESFRQLWAKRSRPV
jgi:L-lactate dehydrogenase complex protein LldF